MSAPKEEVEMVPCEYCRSLMPSTSSSCPICGAPRKS
jgi:RNA polymerase subunit RPABC4/transcription elongation factor Spt4